MVNVTSSQPSESTPGVSWSYRAVPPTTLRRAIVESRIFPKNRAEQFAIELIQRATILGNMPMVKDDELVEDSDYVEAAILLGWDTIVVLEK
jgi:hypothetical protein